MVKAIVKNKTPKRKKRRFVYDPKTKEIYIEEYGSEPTKKRGHR